MLIRNSPAGMLISSHIIQKEFEMRWLTEFVTSEIQLFIMADKVRARGEHVNRMSVWCETQS